MYQFLSLILLLLVGGNSAFAQAAPAYPAQPDFRAVESDPRAITIADEVMAASGGYDTWNNTRYLEWTFFGRRTLLWDKWTGWVRIDVPEQADVYIVNINDLEGKIWLGGEAQTQPDTLQKYLSQARSIWINDSYWLVMPFKLKDSGVKLTDRGEEAAEDGQACDKLELTFQQVGDTPQNKYWVYVDRDTRRVIQWSYFPDASDETPRFTTPWADYRQYDGLWLSGGRGRNSLTNIAVYKEVPAAIFQERDRPSFWP
ncbi:MAG: hypothetical protein KDC54_22555 [Lewinella sp.]|nr:hypothetical protein [Lewinella sp.]